MTICNNRDWIIILSYVMIPKSKVNKSIVDVIHRYVYIYCDVIVILKKYIHSKALIFEYL